MPVETAGRGVLTAISLLLLAGATGKSAQIPLYVWLPDAMEGPTPVSALIHAATMVAAGVYMVARSHVLFLHAPAAMTTVAVIGRLTAFFAATIAMVQTDIKKVLAYSTISQLGYMFLACGVGAFSAGVFHLMTHAFFKGLLFLGAGSVMHALGGEQDMRQHGRPLRRPFRGPTAACWPRRWRSPARPAFPDFSARTKSCWRRVTAPYANPFLYWLGVLTAGMTSFYMFRLLFLTFHGAPRYDQHAKHAHESPPNMLVPLVVLAILSVGGGWWAAPHLFGGVDLFEHFLAPVFGGAAGEAAAVSQGAGGNELLGALLGAPVIAGLLGFLVAWWLYIRRPELPDRIAQSLAAPYRLLSGKYFVDELYAAVIVRPLLWISTRVLVAWHRRARHRWHGQRHRA